MDLIGICDLMVIPAIRSVVKSKENGELPQKLWWQGKIPLPYILETQAAIKDRKSFNCIKETNHPAEKSAGWFAPDGVTIDGREDVSYNDSICIEEVVLCPFGRQRWRMCPGF